MKRGIPILISVFVLVFFIVMMKKSSESVAGDGRTDSSGSATGRSPIPEPSGSATGHATIPESSASSRYGERITEAGKRLGVTSDTPTPLSRAPDFPHNLNTFDGWSELSAEELKKYRVSLISRVGRWDAGKVAEFFFAADSEINEPAAKAEFRKSILGVWCSKDVENCLANMDEAMSVQEATAAKQQALEGWSQEDWLAALHYLQRHGDSVIEQKVGGENTIFFRNIIHHVSTAYGVDEAEGILSHISGPKNRAAAEDQLNLEKSVKTTTNTIAE